MYKRQEFASAAFAKQSYDAAVESEVLLKNEGILPLKGTERILVTGPNANSLRTLNGGWSYTWQGDADSYVPQYNTILEAMQKRFKKVTYVPGVESVSYTHLDVYKRQLYRGALRGAPLFV